MNLASFYIDIGRLSDATKYLLKAREQSTMPAHLADICLFQLSIALELQDYKQMLNHVNRAESMVELESVEAFKTKVTLYKAIGALSENRYKDVAQCLLSLDGEGAFIQSLHQGGGSILSISDIAVMAVITAMSSFSVSEFKASLINRKSFKPILIENPKANSLANSFCTKDFANLFQLVESFTNELSFDVYLSQHAETLTTQITERSVLEYLIPFESVSLQRMNNAFGVDVEGILCGLIGKGTLSARIDGISGTLFKLKESPKQVSIDKIIDLGKNHSHDVRRGILRLSLLEHGFSVSNKEKHTLSTFRAQSSNEADADDIEEGRDYDEESNEII